MHNHRNESTEPAPRRANTPPPVGDVHGLGLVDVLRIELRPAQQHWLVDEIDALRCSCETDMAHWRARRDGSQDSPKLDGPKLREAERQLDYLAYKLQVLALIREQLPLGDEAAAAAVASSWDDPADHPAPEPEPPGAPLVVVGPAAVITALVEGATRNAAEALATALGGPAPGADPPRSGGRRPPGSVVPGVTPAIAEKLRAAAAAAQAYTDTYVDLMLQQGYKFDPAHEPLRFGELE
jgi:hypothetical protein